MKHILVMGTGSRLRGDDGAGPLVIDLLKERSEREGRGSNDTVLTLIDSDVMPENFTRPIRSSGADVVLIIDAVDMGLTPGEIRIVPRERIDATLPCSHTLPMSHVMAYLNEAIPRVDLVGIQIKSTGLYTGMSEEVKRACARLADTIWDRNIKDIPGLEP